MDIFEDPNLQLRLIGKLKTKNSLAIPHSRLCVGFETLDRAMFNPEPCYDRVGQLGVKYARVQTAWLLCEKEKGKYDFSVLDSVVDNLSRRGVETLFNLTFGNPLYMSDIPNPAAVGCIPNLFGEECLAAWHAFVSALAAHFSRRVCLWEIWNEPNHVAFWYPSEPSGQKYADFVKDTAPLIRREIPGAKIIGCSAGVAIEFIRDSILAGLGENIDLFSVHPYGSIMECDFLSGIANIRRLFKRHAPNVKIMQGECGYPSQTYGHHDHNLAPYHATEETQAKYVLRRVVLDYLADMAYISYFHIADLMENVYRQASGVARPPVMLGLLNGLSYTPKRAYYAMQHIAALFDGETSGPEDLFLNGWMMDYNQRREGAIPALALMKGAFIRRGYPLYAWYYPEDLQKEWNGNVSFSVGVIPDEAEFPLINPVIIDCLKGDVYEPTKSEVLYGSRLTFRNLPLADYPIFLTDRRAID